MASGPEDCGVCGAELPPLVNGVLTGCGLTLDAAAGRLADGKPVDLTPLQLRMVEQHALAQ